MKSKDIVRAIAYLDEGSGGGGGGGVESYAQLTDKPQINGVTLQGNKTSENLGMYDKNEVDTLLAAKADADEVYSKSSVYTKTETNNLLGEKANASNVYTKMETIELLEENQEVLVAVYEQTSYADVKAAIDAHKSIVLDMPANNNQFCITFSTYTNGGNALMYAIYKMSDKPTLMTVTLTPQNQWTVSHTDLATQNYVDDGLAQKAEMMITASNGSFCAFTQGEDSFALAKESSKDNVSVAVIGNSTGAYDMYNVPTTEYVDKAVGEIQEGVHMEVGVEKWYGTYTENNVTYQVYSKIIYIPALPSEAGATSYPHGVTDIKQILAAYGFCSNSMIMNAPRQNVQDNIAIYQVQKGGNIQIEVGKDRSTVSAYVVIIYAKNN